MTVPCETRPISPTVSRIVVALENRIRSGVYRNAEWLPTERDLAADFQVSRILIRAAIKELERLDLVTCSPHRRPMVNHIEIRPPMVSPTSRTIALWVWPDPTWPPTGMIIQGVQEALGGEYRLMFGSPVGDNWNETYASEARFLNQIQRDRDIEGLIIGYIGGETNRSHLESLKAAGIPIVFIDHLPPSGFDADYVGVNNRQGAERAVKYLLSLGHRTVAHISNFETISTVAERLAGYRRALHHARIPFRPELVQQDPGPSGNDPEEGCEEIVARLLELPNPPTALFAANDIIALRTIAALRRHGRRVPEDLSVVGFDGIDRWMPTVPFLTTIQQPFDRIGTQALEMLMERIENGPGSPYKHVILDVNLAIHRSTRPL